MGPRRAEPAGVYNGLTFMRRVQVVRERETLFRWLCYDDLSQLERETRRTVEKKR